MLKRVLASRSRPCFNPASTWDTLGLDLSGCRFEITLPPHDYEFPEEADGHNVNLFDEEFYDYDPGCIRAGDAAKLAASFTRWRCTHLFKDKYQLVSFSSTGSELVEPRNKLMFSRINQIIPSVKLKLSPASIKQKAEHAFPNAKYSQSREPEPWQYYGSYRQGDPLESEDSIVFEGECCAEAKTNE